MSRYFEDFTVGDVYRSQVGRTIIDADNVWFTMLTMNTNPIHFDYEYAKKTEFGKPLVNSTFTLSLVVGMSVTDVSQNGVNLGWSSIKMPNPLFVGDTIHVESTILDKRESKSRPHMGIIQVRSLGVKQDGVVVLELERTVRVYRRGAIDAGPKEK